MIVVVDTNIFYGDPLMRKSHFRILFGQHLRGRIALVLPEVVVREVPKLFETQLDAAATTIGAEATKLRELGHDLAAIAVPDSGAARAQFEERLRRGLGERNVRIAPLVGTVDELVDQSVAERRPFRPKSQGFRDALIWRNVLELANEDEVILVTKNSKDFAQDDKHQNVLHQHLRDDLQAAGHAPDRVRLVSSLEDFIKENVPSADELAVAQQRFDSDSEWREELTDNVYNALNVLDLSWWDKITVVATEHAEIDDVAVDDVALDTVTIVDAYETDDEGVVSIEVRADATLWFTFTTDIIGAEWLSDEGADVELEQAAETLFQGRTLGQAVTVIFSADFVIATGELGELEQVVGVDADSDTALPPTRR